MYCEKSIEGGYIHGTGIKNSTGNTRVYNQKNV